MKKKNIIIGIIVTVLLLGVIGMLIYSNNNRDNTKNETGVLDDDKTITSTEDDILNDDYLMDSDDIDKDDDNYDKENNDDISDDGNDGIYDSKDNDGGNNKKEIKYVNKFPHDAYCAQAIDEFYRENGITYYFTCKMSQYIYVVVDGLEYGLVYALENDIVTIEEVEAAKGSKFLSKSNNLYSY